MGEPQRLAKRVAALVPCSRSEAEQYIEAGWVQVDGVVADTPQQRVDDAQRVTVDRAADLSKLAPATFLLNQPPGLLPGDAIALLSPANRWAADTERTPLLRAHLRSLQALMPLPPQAAGLAVFSQHRSVIRKLTEEGAFVEQELLAQVEGAIAPDGLRRLAHGLAREGHPLPPARVSWQSEHRLRFALKGIEADLVPWMCAQVGLKVTQLRRIRLGRLPMAGLPAGQWRRLLPGERF
ncbi:MAG TPA: RNA pseudouridine synthase [Ramlibacter sp.]|jgi:23S rRNA pseudouridine2604 synthase|uniref:RNA pseudouridine synthase n=1 Tax=Ramlibacter sp. TaxID=1917967 RepID=UPI002D6CA220|nr:RNA pseudouridine synthase [Ramlibacter sp.]HZY17661.1 RNA pseudouridine synthase [Ramlibacter sp.]